MSTTVTKIGAPRRRRPRQAPVSIASLIEQPEWLRILAGDIANDFTVKQMTVLLDERNAYDVAALAAKYKVLVSRSKHRTLKRKATQDDVEQALGYIQQVRANNIPHWVIELTAS